MKCKVCEHKTDSFFDHIINKTYHTCPNCELVFLDPSHLVATSKEKEQYDNHNNTIEDEGYVKMFENFLDFFWGNLLVTTTSALDFGSGPGPVLSELIRQRGLKCDIYDKFYSPTKTYKDKKYDLITSTEVFEHLEDPKSILDLLKKHLNQNGTIALMTLFHPNNQEDFFKWWYRRDPTHITFFTPKTFEILSNKCGLKVVKSDYKRVVVLCHM